MKSLLFLLSCLFSLAPRARADAPLISVAVGQAHVKKSPTAFPAVQGSEPKLASLRDVIIADLEMSGVIDFLNPAAFVEAKDAGIVPNSFKLTDWSGIGAELLLKAKGALDEKGLSVEVFLYAVGSGKQLLGQKYAARPDGWRKLAHSVSNDIFFALTGKKGPFTAKLAFVSDKSGHKSVYIADYDGNNPVNVSPRFPLALFPAWSPDGKELVFTADTKNAKNVRNHNLYRYQLATGKTDLLSSRNGLNTGAVYSPDGKQLAVTMSFTGHASIFLMENATKVVSRLTNSYGLDVDPAWSPDGKQLAFVSDRAGKSMVYRMDVSGENVQRLTYAGQYNASPSWSPAGNKIAFAGWEGGAVDIFLMDTDGSNIERLTKNAGDNEDPDFAPGGYFLAYSSNRSGKRNVYITNIDNTVHRPVTSDFGNCEMPHWSPVE